jgi:hypothetical protein
MTVKKKRWSCQLERYAVITPSDYRAIGASKKKG